MRHDREPSPLEHVVHHALRGLRRQHVGGGAAHHEIPAAIYERVMAHSSSLEIGDAEKVHAFVARYPDPDRALAPIRAVADRLDADRETQSLLRAMVTRVRRIEVGEPTVELNNTLRGYRTFRASFRAA